MKTKALLVLFMLPVLGMEAYSQSNSDCPGFRNPSSFNTGNPNFFWSARVGDRTYTSGNQNDTTTGYHIMSTCATATDITGHANITSASYNSGADSYITSCGHNFFDANESRFQIIGPANAGIDQFTIAPGGTGMPRIPPGYTHSIRLGDMRNTGQAVNLNTPGGSHNNKGAEALFYTMYVTSENALLFINYAVVARRYPHSAYDAGEFLIRVVKQNTDGSWPNAPITDSLWYKVSAPQYGAGTSMPLGWEVGAGDPNNWPCTYAYKPWAKVAISLSQYLYEHVRIEMYTSDCIYNADPIYAYISGDFQAMRIDATGCADAASSDIDTLEAPSGLLSYQWFVTTGDYEEDLYDASYMETVSFRQVSEVSTNNMYIPTLSDFVISSGPNTGDTVSTKTFMCKMTSALDPAKPITSKVYVNVTNGKPVPHVYMTSDCDLTVNFTNQSTTFSNINIDADSTRWIVYSDTLCTSVLDTLWGDVVSYRFPTDGYYKVTMRVKVWGKECGSQQTVVCRALQGHAIPIGLSDSLLCEGESAMVYCTENCHLEKEWHIGDSVLVSDNMNHYDTIHWQPPTGLNEITLTTTTDGLCPATSTAWVKVLGNTTLTSNVDASLICRGDTVTLSALGVDEPRWLSVPYDSALGDGNKQNIVKIWPQQTTTYTVVPTHETRCMQNSSTITIMVLQYPIPTIWTNHIFVDRANPLLRLEDRSPYSNSSLWTFSDGMSEQGARVEHYFGSMNDSVSISLHTCNEERCCADTTLWLPVKTQAIWIPNIFTPLEPTNQTFKFVTTLNIIQFDIWIYNRNGALVYHGTDFSKGWDGNRDDGSPCPQGAYAYRYEYKVDTEPDRVIAGTGTVTLLR